MRHNKLNSRQISCHTLYNMKMIYSKTSMPSGHRIHSTRSGLVYHMTKLIRNYITRLSVKNYITLRLRVLDTKESITKYPTTADILWWEQQWICSKSKQREHYIMQTAHNTHTNTHMKTGWTVILRSSMAIIEIKMPNQYKPVEISSSSYIIIFWYKAHSLITLWVQTYTGI